MTAPLHRLAGKVAFITGAARGIGRAEAIRLAKEGADIIAVDLCKPLATPAYEAATAADLAETVRQVEGLDRRIVATEADVRDFDALAAALHAGVAELGRLDAVVANAGIMTAGRAWEITPEQWREVIDVNLTGVFHTLKAAVPILLEQGHGGSIVVTSSVAGLRGLPFLAHYVASKHGVLGLARTFANELAGESIRVNTVHPYGVDTPLGYAPDLAELLGQADQRVAGIYMHGGPDAMSEPADIAATVAWLVSDDARHVTGSAIAVDQGFMAR